jgi:hypothetical protein
MAATDNFNGLLNPSGCFCLNQDDTTPYTNLFLGDENLPLKSNADEQLLLHLSLRQIVKLEKIVLGIPADESCPQTIKLFCNKNNLGFDEASDLPATQEIEVAPSAEAVSIKLNQSKWSRCESGTRGSA